MFKNFKTATFATVLFLGSSTASLAGEYLISVEKDASVIRQSLCCSNAADKNFGASYTVDAGQYHHNSQALFAFDLSQIPSAASIRSADLVFGNVRIVGSEPATFSLGSTYEDWDEESVTWNKHPKSEAFRDINLSSGSNAIDVAAAIVSALESGQSRLTFTVDAKGSANAFISSKEDPQNPASFLRLNVELPVQEPIQTSL